MVDAVSVLCLNLQQQVSEDVTPSPYLVMGREINVTETHGQ